MDWKLKVKCADGIHIKPVAIDNLLVATKRFWKHVCSPGRVASIGSDRREEAESGMKQKAISSQKRDKALIVDTIGIIALHGPKNRNKHTLHCIVFRVEVLHRMHPSGAKQTGGPTGE